MLKKIFMNMLKKQIISQVFGREFSSQEELKSAICVSIQSQKRVPGEIRRVVCEAVEALNIDMGGSIEDQILGLF